jgi:hypothetical protein
MRSEDFRSQLPKDLDPGEAELLEEFDRWIHEHNPNPERIGCPERETLVALVLAKSKFEDEYTLDHIGECGACLDELLRIKRELGQTG